MPYFKGRRRMKKRSYRGRRKFSGASRKSRRGQVNSVLIRSPTFMPDRLSTKHVWTEWTSLTLAGTTANRTYFMNGMTEPFTGATTVPAGFLEMSSIYQIYLVRASSIEVTVSNTYTEPMILAVKGANEGIPAGFTPSEYITNPYCRYKTLAPNGAGGNTKTVKMYAKVGAVRGQPIMSSNSFQGTPSSNPTILTRWFVGVETRATASTFVDTFVKITYYVTWLRREVIDPSVVSLAGPVPAPLEL